MKKSICRAFAIAFAVSIMLTTVIPASAAQPPVIMPAYVGITDLFSGLTISSNGKASCKATTYNNGTHDVTLTIALKQDGSTIKSWNVVTTDGFNSVEKNYFVTSGHSYQVVVGYVLRLIVRLKKTPMKCFTFRAKRGNLQVTRDLASAVFLHYIYRLCNNLHGKNVATHQSIIVLSFSTYYLMFRMIGR